MTRLVIDACLLAPEKAGELRLVVKKEHDYHFKREGKTVGLVTKHLVRVENCQDATGDKAKALWTYVREYYGHAGTQAAAQEPRSWEKEN
jgi:hypothetical protein